MPIIKPYLYGSGVESMGQSLGGSLQWSKVKGANYQSGLAGNTYSVHLNE